MSIAVIVLAGGLVASPGGAPTAHAAPQGIKAAGACTAIVQNLDESQAAVALLDFYKQGGGAPVTVVAPPIPPAAAWGLHLDLTPQLSNGAYAAIVSSDRQLAGVARCFWAASGGDAAYSAPEPGTELVLPVVVKRARNQTSLITIQNTDPNAQATASVSVFSGVGAEVVLKQYAVNPGTSITLDMNFNPDFDLLPPGTYWALVHSPTPLVVQSFVDLENSEAGVYAFEAVPRTAAAAKLVAPAVYAAMPAVGGAAVGIRSTWLAVVNVGESPAQLSITYSGNEGACTGQIFHQGPWTVGPKGLQVANAGSPPSGATGDAGPLPAGCAANAQIESTDGQLIGVAVEEVGQNLRAAAYTLPAVPVVSPPPAPHWSIYLPFGYGPKRASAVTTTRLAAARAPATDWRLSLPSLRRAAPESASGAPMTSEVTVMSMAAEASTLRLSLFDPSGVAIPCDTCAVSLPPWGAHRWWLGDVSAWLTGTVGSAMVASDQPLAATVADLPLRGGWDETMYAAASISLVAPREMQAAAHTLYPFLAKPRARTQQAGRPALPEPVRQYYPFLMR
jgi:hypothetical protein